MRNTLVTALVSCADQPLKFRARRFLMGLSSDELQFIAEFLGACILESDHRSCDSRAQIADRIAQFNRSGGASAEALDDRDHKMILLLEYLCRASEQRFSFTHAVAGT